MRIRMHMTWFLSDRDCVRFYRIPRLLVRAHRNSILFQIWRACNVILDSNWRNTFAFIAWPIDFIRSFGSCSSVCISLSSVGGGIVWVSTDIRPPDLLVGCCMSGWERKAVRHWCTLADKRYSSCFSPFFIKASVHTNIHDARTSCTSKQCIPLLWRIRATVPANWFSQMSAPNGFSIRIHKLDRATLYEQQITSNIQIQVKAARMNPGLVW